MKLYIFCLILVTLFIVLGGSLRRNDLDFPFVPKADQTEIITETQTVIHTIIITVTTTPYLPTIENHTILFAVISTVICVTVGTVYVFLNRNCSINFGGANIEVRRDRNDDNQINKVLQRLDAVIERLTAVIERLTAVIERLTEVDEDLNERLNEIADDL